MERDFVVRFKAQPYPGSTFPKSFADALAENAGFASSSRQQRITWLREPNDGSETFQTYTIDTLLRPAGDPLLEFAKHQLKGKIVILTAMLSDVDVHRTPLGSMHRVFIHAHMTAELLDGRGGGFLMLIEDYHFSVSLDFLAVIATFGFRGGWRFSPMRRRILASRITIVAVVATILLFDLATGDLDWHVRLRWPLVSNAKAALPFFVPGMLAVLSWCLGEPLGHFVRRRTDQHI